MDDLRFDRLSKQIAEGDTRRGLLRVVTGISLVGASALLVHDDGSARARRSRGVQSEHRRKKKAFYCLDGETIRRYRRKQEKLLARGATLGKCKSSGCTPDCVDKECGPDGCGGTCGTGCSGETCCASNGMCVDGTTNNACGTAGNICQVCVAPQECIAFGCTIP